MKLSFQCIECPGWRWWKPIRNVRKLRQLQREFSGKARFLLHWGCSQFKCSESVFVYWFAICIDTAQDEPNPLPITQNLCDRWIVQTAYIQWNLCFGTIRHNIIVILIRSHWNYWQQIIRRLWYFTSYLKLCRELTLWLTAINPGPVKKKSKTYKNQEQNSKRLLLTKYTDAIENEINGHTCIAFVEKRPISLFKHERWSYNCQSEDRGSYVNLFF